MFLFLDFDLYLLSFDWERGESEGAKAVWGLDLCLYMYPCLFFVFVAVLFPFFFSSCFPFLPFFLSFFLWMIFFVTYCLESMYVCVCV